MDISGSGPLTGLESELKARLLMWRDYEADRWAYKILALGIDPRNQSLIFGERWRVQNDRTKSG